MRNKYKPKVTNDPDASAVNSMLDDVGAGIKLGSWLFDLFDRRFDRNIQKFRKWVSINIDRDEQTLCRKMILSQHAGALSKARITRLSDAYEMLDLSGSVTFKRLLM